MEPGKCPGFSFSYSAGNEGFFIFFTFDAF